MMDCMGTGDICYDQSLLWLCSRHFGKGQGVSRSSKIAALVGEGSGSPMR